MFYFNSKSVFTLRCSAVYFCLFEDKPKTVLSLFCYKLVTTNVKVFDLNMSLLTLIFRTQHLTSLS